MKKTVEADAEEDDDPCGDTLSSGTRVTLHSKEDAHEYKPLWTHRSEDIANGEYASFYKSLFMTVKITF